MKTSDAIAELARRQIKLEERLTKLEAALADDEEVGDPWEVVGQTIEGHDVVKGQPDPRLAARPLTVDEELASIKGAWYEQDGDLVFMPPTPAQRRLRERIVKHIHFEDWRQQDAGAKSEGSVPLDPEAAAEAYIEGGPGWLYHYDRAFVTSLGPELRAAMVEDVAAQSPTQAHELARDLLKDEQNLGEGLNVSDDNDRSVGVHGA